MALRLHKNLDGIWILDGSEIHCEGCICELDMGMGLGSFCSSCFEK